MMTNPPITDQQRYQETRFITLVGASVNIFLSAIKIIMGILGHSQALVADGIHSFADLLTDAIVIFAAKIGNQAADENHPYGHRRIETAATVALAVFLVIIGLAIMIDGVRRLWLGVTLVKPDFYVVLIAFISVCFKEVYFRISLRIAKRIQSDLLKANAWHSRSDAFASLIVLIGVIGASFGYTFMDESAAIIVGAMIIKMGISLGWHNMRELVDTGLEPQIVAEITNIISSVPGVENIHELRTRSMGGQIYVDVHILVAPHLSVSEGHYIGEQVREHLLKKHLATCDVIVHIDPEDDALMCLYDNLPDRLSLESKLKTLWHELPGSNDIHHLTLHYLSGKIAIELYLPLHILTTNYPADKLAKLYQEKASQLDFISELQLFFV